MPAHANLLGVAALLLAWPAAAQDAPKSILPPGFRDPAPVERSAPVALPPVVDAPAPPGDDAPPIAASADPAALGVAPVDEVVAPPATSDATAIARAGLLTPEQGGLGDELWRASDGRYLTALVNRMQSPRASRWMQILLQRALLSVADAPAGVNAADWLAARGRALTRMGSATDAHRMILAAPTDRFTADLYLVAGEAAIAAGDPLALCPLTSTARTLTTAPVWELADGVCAAIEGDDDTPARLFDRLRASNAVASLDVGLAERIASAAGEGRRAANPAWDEVEGLTTWRLSLASAAGLAIPEPLLTAVTPAQAALAFRLAGLPLARRALIAPLAVATGAAGSAEANRLFAALLPSIVPAEVADSAAGQLRVAWTAPDADDRVAAMRSLLAGAPNVAQRLGWQAILGPAMARITPSPALRGAAADIVECLVAAGMADAARRWAAVAADAEGATGDRAWAVLAALGGGGDRYADWAKSASPHRAALLAAGLHGLGRRVGPRPDALDNDWTRALDRAVAARRPGEVIAVAATGMGLGWANVPPDYLRRVVVALVAVGHQAEARLIVAEAATRG